MADYKHLEPGLVKHITNDAMQRDLLISCNMIHAVLLNQLGAKAMLAAEAAGTAWSPDIMGISKGIMACTLVYDLSRVTFTDYDKVLTKLAAYHGQDVGEYFAKPLDHMRGVHVPLISQVGAVEVSIFTLKLAHLADSEFAILKLQSAFVIDEAASLLASSDNVFAKRYLTKPVVQDDQVVDEPIRVTEKDFAFVVVIRHDRIETNDPEPICIGSRLVDRADNFGTAMLTAPLSYDALKSDKRPQKFTVTDGVSGGVSLFIGTSGSGKSYFINQSKDEILSIRFDEPRRNGDVDPNHWNISKMLPHNNEISAWVSFLIYSCYVRNIAIDSASRFAFDIAGSSAGSKGIATALPRVMNYMDQMAVSCGVNLCLVINPAELDTRALVTLMDKSMNAVTNTVVFKKPQHVMIIRSADDRKAVVIQDGVQVDIVKTRSLIYQVADFITGGTGANEGMALPATDLPKGVLGVDPVPNVNPIADEMDTRMTEDLVYIP